MEALLSGFNLHFVLCILYSVFCIFICILFVFVFCILYFVFEMMIGGWRRLYLGVDRWRHCHCCLIHTGEKAAADTALWLHWGKAVAKTAADTALCNVHCALCNVQCAMCGVRCSKKTAEDVSGVCLKDPWHCEGKTITS